MAILKQRLHRKNDSGTYDTVYLENLATNVKLSETDSTLLSIKLSSMDTNINSKQPAGSYAAANHNHSGVYQPVGSYATTTELNEVKTSVSNGKSLIASAITDKGVSTASSATFQVMSNNIRSIPTSTTSGVSIWVYSEGMPSDGSIIATKNGYSISAMYVSTFNWFKIALPTSGYEGTWTITGSYGGFSNSANCYVSGSTTRDYFLTVNVLPIFTAGSRYRFNDTITRPSTIIKENFGNKMETSGGNTPAVYAYSWYDNYPEGRSSKEAYGMEIGNYGGIITYRWNVYEGASYCDDGHTWNQGDMRIFQFINTYTVGMAFYSYIINNTTRIR